MHSRHSCRAAAGKTGSPKRYRLVGGWGDRLAVECGAVWRAEASVGGQFARWRFGREARSGQASEPFQNVYRPLESEPKWAVVN
jgi:hypothetical protein